METPQPAAFSLLTSPTGAAPQDAEDLLQEVRLTLLPRRHEPLNLTNGERPLRLDESPRLVRERLAAHWGAPDLDSSAHSPDVILPRCRMTLFVAAIDPDNGREKREAT